MAALITIAEFQSKYSVSRSTVYRLADRGEIQFVHVGRAVRIRREDADKWYSRLSDKADAA